MRSLSRRAAIKGIGAVALSSLTASWARAGEPALTFLAVGDWGRDGAFHQADVAKAMGETAARIGARFVISAGDNFYEDGVAGVSDPKWRTSFEEVYVHRALQVPWHVALGNHDYHGDTDAQIAYSKLSPRWRLPARWHVRRELAPDGTSLDLFFLDTSPFISAYWKGGAEKVKVGGQNPGAQIDWLERTLAASRADWKVVVGHHPIWSAVDSPAAPDMLAKIDPILRGHGVALYMNGHDHDLHHIEKNAFHYVCVGAGSKMVDQCDPAAGGDFCSVRSGFAAMRLTKRTLDVAYRDWTGAELHVARVTRDA